MRTLGSDGGCPSLLSLSPNPTTAYLAGGRHVSRPALQDGKSKIKAPPWSGPLFLALGRSPISASSLGGQGEGTLWDLSLGH